MVQQPIFTINIVTEEPPLTQTADLKLIGYGDDGHRYALKTLEDHALLPLTEWFCYHLCRAVGIQTPDFFIVKRKTNIAFGSRYEGNADQLDPAKKSPEPIIARLTRLFGDNQKQISAIYGIDFFLPNNDRHLNNFLFRLSGRTSIPLAFDFSQAWVILGLPFGVNAWETGSKSQKAYDFLKAQNWIVSSETMSILDKIEQLPDNFVEQVVDSAPVSWLDNFDKQATINYWQTQRKERINIAKTKL
jgi:hypothetical protein